MNTTDGLGYGIGTRIRFGDNQTNDVIAHAAEQFFPNYIQCLVFIALGYLCGRVAVFPTSGGKSVLASYIFNIALPAGVLANVNDRDGSASLKDFLISICVVKLMVYVGVIATGVLMARRARLNWGIIFLLAHCSIHSNDFGIGEPLMRALFDTSNNSSVQKYPHFMEDSTAVTYSVFAPLTIFFLELRRNREMRLTWPKACAAAFLRALFKPITIAALVGISLRFTIAGTSNFYSMWISGVLGKLSATITPVYLIYTGLVLVGSVQTLSNIKQAALIAAIVTIKVLINPLLLQLVSTINTNRTVLPLTKQETNQELSAFMFIYGALPSSPAIVIFASQFGLMTSAFAIIVILSTLVFAPVAMGALTLYYVGNCTLHHEATIALIISVSRCLNGCTLAVTCWVVLIVAFVSLTRRAAQLLFIAQCLSLVGYCSLSVGYNITKVSDRAAKAIVFGKTFLECEWALLGCGYLFCVSLTKLYNRVFDKVVLWYFLTTTICNLAFLSITCFLVPPNHKYNRRKDAIWDYKNHNTCFTIAKLVVLLSSLGIGLYPHIQNCIPSLRAPPAVFKNYDYTDEQDVSESTALRDFRREKMGKNPKKNVCGLTETEIAKLQYVALLTFKMTLFNFFLNLWSLFKDNEKMFLDLVFIKHTLLLCLGVIIFLMFGLPAADVIKQFKKLKERWDSVLTSNHAVDLPPVSTLPGDVILTCQRFVQYHHTACSNAICKDVQGVFGARLFEDVFTGEDLVSWLINVGLVEDRSEGVEYGSKLMLGRIFEHVEPKKNYFHDMPTHYHFITAKPGGARFGDTALMSPEGSAEFPSELHTINRDVPDWL